MDMKLSEKDLVDFSSDPLTIFYASLKSHFTIKQYTSNLKYFVCNVLEDVLNGSFEERAKQLVELGKKDPEKTARIMYTYAKVLKERTELPKTDPNYIGTSVALNRCKPIQKFFEMNDVLFNWKRLRSTLPEKRYDYPDMRGYTKEEIRKILKFSTGPANTSIVLVASSSGIRTGAFDFKWGDIKPVYKKGDQIILESTEDEIKDAEIACAIIIVYRGSARDEYQAFITPEAYHSLMDYKKDWIRKTCREPKDSDYVFKKPGHGNIPLGVTAITARISKLIWKAGIRTGLADSQKRYATPVMHGFRKFFNKTIKNTPSGSQFIGQYIIKES